MNNQQRNALPQDQNIDQIPDSPSPEPEWLRARSPGTPRLSGSPRSTASPPRFYSPPPRTPTPPPLRTPTPPPQPQLVWNERVNYYVTPSENLNIEQEQIVYDSVPERSWEIVFNLENIRPDISIQYPFKDILSIPDKYRSNFEKYILRQRVHKPPVFPVHFPQPRWEFIGRINSIIVQVSEDETKWTLARLAATNTLPTSTPSPATQVEINRLKRRRQLLYMRHRLGDVFEDRDSLFEYICNIIATVIIETRAVVWQFGSESKVFHDCCDRISSNSFIRRQCACHMITNYNAYTHYRTQSGFSEGFGWAHREFVYSNAGASICTQCKVDKFVEGYPFHIKEQHDDSLYYDCVCESLVHPPADII